MSRKKGQEKVFEIKWKTDLPYRYSIGKLAVKFFEELKKNKKIMGSKLSPRGTLEGFTVVNYPFTDPATGGLRPFPYGYALFKLDGADTYTMHFINETDHTKMKVGQRVEAVFKEEREGNIGDIMYYKIIKEEK